jgi:CBS domain-containing protein
LSLISAAKKTLKLQKDKVMKIKDIMSKNVVIVAPETLLLEVARKMQQSDCGSILVGEDDRLVGMITDRDLALRCVAESHHPAETNAEQVMTKEILYCLDSDEMEDVALNMTKNKVRRLPVLDKDKRLVGIISLGDLASHSTDQHYLICGKALGQICAVPGQDIKGESNAHHA